MAKFKYIPGQLVQVRKDVQGGYIQGQIHPIAERRMSTGLKPVPMYRIKGFWYFEYELEPTKMDRLEQPIALLKELAQGDVIRIADNIGSSDGVHFECSFCEPNAGQHAPDCLIVRAQQFLKSLE
jgi:hypothetical protein